MNHHDSVDADAPIAVLVSEWRARLNDLTDCIRKLEAENQRALESIEQHDKQEAQR